jgi:uracil-DNA glycosylase
MSAERVKLTLGQRSAAVSTANPQGPVNETFDQLLAEVRACTVCAPHLPFGPRPVLRGRPSARLLIISQAPGTRAHESGLSFNDRSGDKLRQWLALGWETFYDESRVAIMPIGLCYPGRDARGGDLPPRRECAQLWHTPLRAALPAIELTLLVGSYAIYDYLPHSRRHSMTETVARWREFLPETLCCRIRVGIRSVGCATTPGSRTRPCRICAPGSVACSNPRRSIACLDALRPRSGTPPLIRFLGGEIFPLLWSWR